MSARRRRQLRLAPDKLTAVYTGVRSVLGSRVNVKSGRKFRDLPPRHELLYHSRDFGWGYGGAGPSQLALAIIADLTDDSTVALSAYSEFTWRVIAQIKENEWRMTGEEIKRHIEEIIND